MPRDEVPPLTEDEAEFVEVVRARTVGWVPSTAPEDWYDGMQVGSDDGRCLVWADLIVDNSTLLTVGAYYNGAVTTTGSLHTQLFVLDRDDIRVLPSTFGGPVSEQAAGAADWLDRLVRRPIRRRDWSGTAREYAFADDGTSLVVSGSQRDRSGPPLRESVLQISEER
ncbi:hypothetical protein ACQHIV_28945 [Kribbella sp. GL6]|uniref:hypothetical protein n=1 Tax=Kribbella sp. GL6 TaxID=3419765 RepID=UPI003D063224